MKLINKVADKNCKVTEMLNVDGITLHARIVNLIKDMRGRKTA